MKNINSVDGMVKYNSLRKLPVRDLWQDFSGWIRSPANSPPQPSSINLCKSLHTFVNFHNLLIFAEDKKNQYTGSINPKTDFWQFSF